MVIEKVKINKRIPINQVKAGEVFEWDNLYFIKLDGDYEYEDCTGHRIFNALEVSSGALESIDDDTLVLPVTSKLSIAID